MSKWRVMLAVAMAACAGIGVLAPSAGAATPADCTPPTQERGGRADGDDPTVTAPATPTCDDAGYDIAFPDAPLETDAPPAANEAPAVSGGGGTGTTYYPDYSLPRTDVDGHVLLLVLLALIGISGGLLVHVLVWLRQEDAFHA